LIVVTIFVVILVNKDQNEDPSIGGQAETKMGKTDEDQDKDRDYDGCIPFRSAQAVLR